MANRGGGNDDAFGGLAIALVGVALLVEGLLKRRARFAPPASWWGRNWRYLLRVGPPPIVFVAISIARLPTVLTRIDDGDRSARLIEGNGVAHGSLVA
jgi:hypothetical protein